MNLKSGAPYDAARVDAALKALYATGQYKDVRITEQDGTLHVALVEAPLIRAIAFQGNSEITTETLNAKVRLKPQAPYSVARAHEDAFEIRSLYQRQGRLATTVTPRFDLDATGTGTLTYVIVEAKVQKVREVRFSGNKAFSSSELEGVIRTTQSGWLDILKSDAFFDPERLDIDRELLLAHYRKNGYADAKVVSAEAIPDDNGSGYVVTYGVDEGPLFTLSDATVESRLSSAPSAPLVEKLSSQRGETYDRAKAEETANKLTEDLFKRGNSFAVVRATEERDGNAHTVKLTYVVEELPHIYIERIDIRGNTRTKDRIIRRELKFAEGDALHPQALARARTRLKSLGIFKTVRLIRENASSADRAVLVVEVEEDDTREIGLGLGFSENDGVIGDVSLEERNLMGNGQYARIKLATGAKRQDIELAFTEPHVLDTDLSAGTNLVYKNLDQKSESSFRSRQAGGNVSAGYAISEQWSAQVKYMLTRNDLRDVGAEASEAIKEAARNSSNGTYYTSALGFSVAYDDRGSKQFPKSGTLISLGQEFAGIGGDVRYIRSSADLRAYYPVSEQITLAGRVQAGTIAGWGGSDVRLLDMYYRGGDLVRGFAPSGIGPRDALSRNADALGGTTYVGTSLAAQFDVPLVPKDIGLRGEVFADAGTLFGLNKSTAALPGIVGGQPAVRASVGAGLIWDSPVGPLRADYAIPVVSQSFDKTRNLSFGLGQF